MLNHGGVRDAKSQFKRWEPTTPKLLRNEDICSHQCRKVTKVNSTSAKLWAGRTKQSRFYQFSSYRYTEAKGCQHIHCLQRREIRRGRWLRLHRTSPSTLMPLGCPTCLQTPTSVHLDFSSGLNYHISHLLLSTLTLVFRQSSISGLPATPLHPHSFQPCFSFRKSLGSTPIHLLRPFPVLNDQRCL